jgi:alpha-ketoglutarate-dependent taurine dioxygenase
MNWRGRHFASHGDFTVRLNSDDRQEIRQTLRQAYEEVRSGRGFVLLRGLPIDRMDLGEFITEVWGIGRHFGSALSQNAEGELIGHVVDATRKEVTPRLFRSNLELRPHTDNTAMVLLACWNRSQAGGDTILTSAMTVHEELRKRRPDLFKLLRRGFHCHRRGEQGPGEEAVTPYRIPVFALRDGMLSCRYQRALIAAGHRELGLPLSLSEVEALELFDEIAMAPENRLAFNLERGDVLVINNYTVLHARTRFTEHPDPQRRRHLLRLWLDADGFRKVPAEVRLFPSANGVPPQQGRSCSYDFEKLYREDPVASGGRQRLDPASRNSE